MTRYVLLAITLVVTGAAYVLLAGVGLAAALAFAIAATLVALAWWLDGRLELSGWAQLVGVLAAMLVLLAAKDWRGDVPWQFLTFTIVTILVFALFALGLNLEYGFGGLINFGHVAFMSAGAYVVVLLALEGGLWTTQAGVWAALLLGLGAAALCGIVMTLPAVRLRADYLAIVTIAAAEIFRRFLLNEDQWTQGPRGVVLASQNRPLVLDWIEGVPWVGPPLVDQLRGAAEALGIRGSPYALVLLILAVVATLVTIVVIERLVHSPWGRVVRAIREDEDAARALGIAPNIYKVQLLAIGSAIAGLAGALWAWQTVFIAPMQFEAPVTFWAWIMIILGGVGNNKGAVAGAFIFWTVNVLTRNIEPLREVGLDSEQVAAFATLALGLLIVTFMVFRPQGLFGRREELELVA